MLTRFLARKRVARLRARRSHDAAVADVQRVGRGFLARQTVRALRAAARAAAAEAAAVRLQRVARGVGARAGAARAGLAGAGEVRLQARRLPWELAELCVCIAAQLGGGSGPEGGRGVAGRVAAQAAAGTLVSTGRLARGRVLVRCVEGEGGGLGCHAALVLVPVCAGVCAWWGLHMMPAFRCYFHVNGVVRFFSTHPAAAHTPVSCVHRVRCFLQLCLLCLFCCVHVCLCCVGEPGWTKAA